MSRQATFEDYEGFVEKFKPKLTTDDCYTPDWVYDWVRGWVDRNVAPLDGLEVVRPFWPGADYRSVEYGPDTVVIDNPPFSILASIVDWYLSEGVRFFLFAPSLTLTSYCNRPRATAVAASLNVTYHNGAVVRTGFVTDMWPTDSAMVVAGSMHEEFDALYKARRKAERKTPAKLTFPDHVISAAHTLRLAARGIDWEIPRAESAFVRKLDCGRVIYGAGLLLSERLAAERLVAERLAAERLVAENLAAERLVAENLAAEKLPLSDREWEIIRNLRRTNTTTKI